MSTTSLSRPDTALLQSLTPLGQLGTDAFREVAAKAVLERVPPGRSLFKVDQRDDWAVYVVEGTVTLEYVSGSRETVAGRGVAARMPLAPQQPRRATATASTEVRCVRISSSLLEVLAGAGRAPACDLEAIEAEDERVENRLLHNLFDDYVHDRLEVPLLPDVAVRVRSALEDPDASVHSISRIVTADPSIAARLIQVANSAAYRGVAPVEDCRDAVGRLGIATTRDLVTAFALKKLFATDSAMLRKRFVDLWRHSTRVAAISFALARVTPGIGPDRALLAGLVHDVGALAVLSRAGRFPELMDDDGQMGETLALLRGQIGSMVMRKWGFPDDFVRVAVECEDWTRDRGPKPDYCDVVLVAQLFSFFGTDDAVGKPPLASVPAVGKLAGGGLDADACRGILAESADLISEMEGLVG